MTKVTVAILHEVFVPQKDKLKRWRMIGEISLIMSGIGFSRRVCCLSAPKTLEEVCLEETLALL